MLITENGKVIDRKEINVENEGIIALLILVFGGIFE
jgi:hypothetical protein